MREYKDARMTILMTQSDKNTFNKCCEANGETMSRILIDFIRGYIKQNKYKLIGGEQN
ncbi:hypothetical protein LCGC14_0405390 [marine sediment metagenome]|uniref:CopG family transcriptional regulator n=1 Tax=marine sediment metagenome TaxID=412755 RepID=A0A0F9SVG4_9ZZZZ